MRVWFFGSRSLERLTGPGALAARNTTLLRINQAVRKIGAGAVVVTGACPTGPDAWAERAATRRGLQVERHPPDWNTHGRKAGILRNEEMAASRPDFAVGAWDRVSRGTRHSIAMCRKYGIPFVVYGPKGDVIDSGPRRE